MSYEEKYLKYKNKYLALKNQILNMNDKKSSILDYFKLPNLFGGAEEDKNNLPEEGSVVKAPAENATEVSVQNTETTIPSNDTDAQMAKVMADSDAKGGSVEGLFKQNGGLKKNKSVKRRKHFFDDSDITDEESLSSSEFSSSDLDF